MKLLIDGTNLLHRCHWVDSIQTREPLITKKNVRIGATYYFLNSIKSYTKQFSPNEIYVCWDKRLTPGIPNFRQLNKDIDYKAGRDKSNLQDMFNQEPLLAEALKALGIKNMYPGVLEADDIIAWLTTKLTEEKIIISADIDFAQLVKPNTHFYSLSKKLLITTENFKDVFNIEPNLFLLYRAILGDKSDNIPGLEGYGKIKTQTLLEKNDGIFEHLKEEQIKKVEQNLKMMDLARGIIEHKDEEKIFIEQFLEQENITADITKFKSICTEYQFNKFLTKMNEWENLFKSVKPSPLLKLFSK